MRTRLACLAVLLSGAVYGAPGDYPLTINSRAASAPQVQVYRASPRAFALTFVDGATASDITGHTVWMSWSTNAYASTVSTAACAIVSGTGGTARAVFVGQTFNYAPGRYIYEVGVATAGVPQTVRQGVLVIEGSPYAAGGSITTWTTNLYFAQYQFMDVFAEGPYRFSSTYYTHTTNADGSINPVPSGFATGTPVYVEADATALGAVTAASNSLQSAITTETGRATIAEAALVPRVATNGAEWGSHDALYPRSNPSNWITSASVPSGTNYATAAQGAKADAAYPASNPSNYVAGDFYPSSNPSNYYRASNPSNFVDRTAATSGMQEAGNYFVVGTNSGVTVVSNVVGSQWIKIGLNGGDGYSPSITLRESDNDNEVQLAATAAGYLSRNNQVMWDTGNDGAGSGLDADTVDGQGVVAVESDPIFATNTVRIYANGVLKSSWGTNVAAAVAAAVSNDVVMIGAGTYTIGADMSPGHGVALRGISASATRLIGSILGANNDWSLSGLTIENPVLGNYGVNVQANGTRIRDCEIYGEWDGIIALTSTDLIVERSTLRSRFDSIATGYAGYDATLRYCILIADSRGSPTNEVGVEHPARGVRNVGANVLLEYCTIMATATNGIEVYGVYNAVGSVTATLCRVTADGGKATPVAMYNEPGAELTEYGCEYSTSSGTIGHGILRGSLDYASITNPPAIPSTNGLASTGYVAVAVAPLVATNDAAYLNLLTNTATAAQGAKADAAAPATTVRWTETGTTVYPTNLAQNVGIGTNAAGAKLHVYGPTNQPVAIFDGPATWPANAKIVDFMVGGTSVANVDEDGDIQSGVSAARTVLLGSSSSIYCEGASGYDAKLSAVAGNTYINNPTPNIALSDATAGHDNWLWEANADETYWLQSTNDAGYVERVRLGSGGGLFFPPANGTNMVAAKDQKAGIFAAQDSADTNNVELFALDDQANYNPLTPTIAGQKVAKVFLLNRHIPTARYVTREQEEKFMREVCKKLSLDAAEYITETPNPYYTPWESDEADRKAARDGEIAAWTSDTNAPAIKGAKPQAYKSKGKPKIVADWEANRK